LALLNGCGVKGDPVSPKEVVTPSLIENYPDIDLKEPLNDNKQL
jgi:hypothetical protein